MPDEIKVTVSVDWMAKSLGVSRRWIEQLSTDGIIPRLHRGVFDAETHVANLLGHYKRKLDEKPESTNELESEKIRETRERADKLALDNAERRGEVIPTRLAQKLLEEVIVELKNKVLASIAIDEKEKDDLLETIRQINADSIMRRLDSELSEVSNASPEDDAKPVGGQVSDTEPGGEQHSGEVSSEVRTVSKAADGRRKGRRRYSRNPDVRQPDRKN